MSLADFVPERKEISYRGRPLVTVRGLTASDISQLVRGHLPDLTAIYSMFKDGKLLPEPDQIEVLVFSLLTKVPNTAARMIALACDEPGGVDDAIKLPAPIQMDIMMTIVKLTFEDVGGPLAFSAMVRQAFLALKADTPKTIQ